MDSLSPEQYLINKAKLAQTRDSYEAKAWIITAKTLFPQDFYIQFSAFEAEKLEVCVCVFRLNEMKLSLTETPSLPPFVEEP